MCPATTANVLGLGVITDEWNASAYAALAKARKLSAAVKSHAAILILAKEVWRLDNGLRKILSDLYTSVEHPKLQPEPITEEMVHNASRACLQLHARVDEIYELAKRAGLLNRSFVGAAFNSVKVRAEELQEIGDWLELSLNRDVDVMLDQSLQDLRSGEMVDLPTFK